MPDITKSYKIPNAAVPELVEVFGSGYETQVFVNGELVSNPQTKAQFASAQLDREILEHIKDKVRQYRRTKALSELSNDFDVTTV